MILAEVTPPPGTAEWLSVFFFLLGGVWMILKIIGHFTRKPAIEAEFVSKLEFSARFAELERQLASVRRQEQDHYDKLIEAGEGRANAIQDRLSEIALDLTNSVGELRGELRRMQ